MTDLMRRLAARVGRTLFSRRPERPPYPVFEAARPVPLPRHRSPYGLDTPLDPAAARAVRPYVEAA